MEKYNKIIQREDNEIDLFDLLQTFWDEKWLISAFIAIGALVGGAYLSL